MKNKFKKTRGCLLATNCGGHTRGCRGSSSEPRPAPRAEEPPRTPASTEVKASSSTRGSGARGRGGRKDTAAEEPLCVLGDPAPRGRGPRRPVCPAAKGTVSHHCHACSESRRLTAWQ